MTDIQITGFEVISKLGEGGMAAVWKARQISLDRTVAIKILSSHFASDSADILRFQQEAQSAAKLKHPGIVQVYDANIENGLYFFVMEFVDGYTCADWLIRKGVLSEKDVLLIADCVADALAYAWDREKMIHCDIKPDNIMIDEDGTVKVTDLGLSRTISSMSGGEESEEILGTPAYMAPEQAMGEANPDCRLDMYALGAMMYHLSTGKLLFEDCPEDEVMEKQVNDTAQNPKDLNPSLSLGFCTLIEVLMAKEKGDRPADWGTVRDAIGRVKKGHLPRLHLPEGAQSTILKSVVAEHATAAKSARAASRVSPTGEAGGRRSLVPIVGVVVALLVIAVVAFKIFTGGGKPGSHQPVEPVVPPSNGGGEEVDPADQQARTLYYAASKWEKSNAASYDASIVNYQRVVNEAPGSQYADRAKRDIARLENSKKDMGIENALKGLEAGAAPWLRQHQFDKVIEMYEFYRGTAASETQADRNAKVIELRAAKQAWEIAEKARIEAEAEASFNALLDSAVALITRSDFAGAAGLVRAASPSGAVPGRDEELKNLISCLEAAANIDSVILDSFRKDKGGKIIVQFAAGPKSLVVTDVRDGVVIASEVLAIGGAMASVEKKFVLADIAMSEKLRRMGEDSEPSVALVKGVMAYQSCAFTHARRYFEMAHHLLMTRLLALLGGASVEAEADAGQSDLAALLKTVGVEVGDGFDAARWMAGVMSAQLTSAQAAQVKTLATEYKAKHGASSFYEQARPVLAALMTVKGAAEPQPEPGPEFVPPPVDLPPPLANMVGDADKVVEALLAANPELGSESIAIKKDSAGKVTSITVESSGIANISALAALRDLREFVCVAHWKTPSQLSDLSALSGLPLNNVHIDSSKVSDLTPLRGLPIQTLRVTNCGVRDLSPLRGMQLVSADFSGTKVFDFSVLNQMPLKHFAAAATQIKSISFMRNMQLQSINLNDTGVFDFSPLSRMPVKNLAVSRTQFKSLSVLRDCPLEVFEANGTGIRDISGLKAAAGTLTSLSIDEAPAQNFSVLKDLNLTVLSVSGTSFADAALISHMKLQDLNVSNSKATSLDGVDASEMKSLNIEGTSISSIAFLRNSPIKKLLCRGSRVRNFMPIYDSSLMDLFVDDPAEKWAIYAKLPALKRVNHQNIHANPRF